MKSLFQKQPLQMIPSNDELYSIDAVDVVDNIVKSFEKALAVFKEPEVQDDIVSILLSYRNPGPY